MKVDIAVSLCLDVEGTMHLAPCVHAYKSQLSPLHVIFSLIILCDASGSLCPCLQITAFTFTYHFFS